MMSLVLHPRNDLASVVVNGHGRIACMKMILRRTGCLKVERM